MSDGAGIDGELRNGAMSRKGRVVSGAYSAGIVAIALLALVFLGDLQAALLAVTQAFDEQGFVSNPDWLFRPVLTVAAILLIYAALRSVFERVADELLERWVVFGRTRSRLRQVILAVTYVGAPLLFALFVYSITNPFYRSYYGEDGLFENATAFLLFLAGFLMLLSAVRVLRSRVPRCR